jgi:hypothetical protein
MIWKRQSLGKKCLKQQVIFQGILQRNVRLYMQSWKMKVILFILVLTQMQEVAVAVQEQEQQKVAALVVVALKQGGVVRNGNTPPNTKRELRRRPRDVKS